MITLEAIQRAKELLDNNSATPVVHELRLRQADIDEIKRQVPLRTFGDDSGQPNSIMGVRIIQDENAPSLRDQIVAAKLTPP